ncbi:hypothetical protein T492DRAFT_944421 [Pavlovales sp. CCMP2436]|nr:hypothetical protein T492DRAFT_944421 [Pavlovales sp. CCMP2436]
MGYTKFYPLLKDCMQTVTHSSLKGKRIGIDLMMMLHVAAGLHAAEYEEEEDRIRLGELVALPPLRIVGGAGVVVAVLAVIVVVVSSPPPSLGRPSAARASRSSPPLPPPAPSSSSSSSSCPPLPAFASRAITPLYSPVYHFHTDELPGAVDHSLAIRMNAPSASGVPKCTHCSISRCKTFSSLKRLKENGGPAERSRREIISRSFALSAAARSVASLALSSAPASAPPGRGACRARPPRASCRTGLRRRGRCRPPAPPRAGRGTAPRCQLLPRSVRGRAEPGLRGGDLRLDHAEGAVWQPNHLPVQTCREGGHDRA